MRAGPVYSIQSARDLFKPFAGPLLQIGSLAGLQKSLFDVYYGAPLHRFALYAQAHDDTLERCLELVIRALKRRQGFILPPGAEPEVVAGKADLWTYAVFICAVGISLYPVLSHQVQLFDGQRRPLRVWKPWEGDMGARGGAFYRRGEPRPFDESRQLAVATFRALLGDDQRPLAWLWRERELLGHCLAFIGHQPEAPAVLRRIVLAQS